MCRTVNPFRVSCPTYESTTFGRAESDPSAGKNQTASVKQLFGEESPVPLVGFRQVSQSLSVDELRISFLFPLDSCKSIRLSPVWTAERVTVPVSLTWPTVQLTLPDRVTSRICLPPVIATIDWAA